MTMTFPNRTDLEFFQSRQRLPRWTSRIQIKSGDAAYQSERSRVLIDDVVNAHAKIQSTSGELAAHNLLVLVRSYQRRKTNLVAELLKLTTHPECAINPEKRSAFARKWANRLETR